MCRKIFINRRRKGCGRRKEVDPCKEMPIDIYHRKRRKSSERRKIRTLDEDYYAFLSSNQTYNDESKEPYFH